MAAGNPEIEEHWEKEKKYLEVLEDLEKRREDCKNVKLQIELLKLEKEKNLREKEIALRERKKINKEKEELSESQKKINRLVDVNEQLTAKNLDLQEKISQIDQMLDSGVLGSSIKLRTIKKCLKMLHGIADILLPQTEESQKLMAKIGNLEKEVNDRRKFQIMDFTQDLHDLLHEIIGFDKSTREYYE